jgi:hypothetical protein
MKYLLSTYVIARECAMLLGVSAIGNEIPLKDAKPVPFFNAGYKYLDLYECYAGIEVFFGYDVIRLEQHLIVRLGSNGFAIRMEISDLERKLDDFSKRFLKPRIQKISYFRADDESL